MEISEIAGLSAGDLAWMRSVGVHSMPRLTRSQFFALRPSHQAALAKAGFVPVDDPAPAPTVAGEGEMLRSEFNKLDQAGQRQAARSMRIID
jgi:hypothetical protein